MKAMLANLAPELMLTGIACILFLLGCSTRRSSRQMAPFLALIALVFVIFEVEIAFMFPVAAVYKSFIEKGQGLLAFAEIFLFVAILAVGLAYVWAMGDLNWVKGLKQEVLQSIRDRQQNKPIDTSAKKAA